MKISKTLSNIIVGVTIAVATAIIGGVGTFIYSTLDTIQHSKDTGVEVKRSIDILNKNFITFTDFHKTQSIAYNSRMNGLQDSLTCYRSESKSSYSKLEKSSNKVIWYLKMTDKKFNDTFNISQK